MAPEPELTAADVAQRAFTFVWSGAPAGRHVLKAVATDDGGGTGESQAVPVLVRDNGQPPVVRIVAADPYAAERPGQLPPNTARFKVHRTGHLGGELAVFYSLHGTAQNGKDYVELPGSVVIPVGRRHADIEVVPIHDTDPERIETVLVKLEASPAMGPFASYEIGWPAKAVAVIVDNDEPTPGMRPLPEDVFHLSVPAETGQPFRIEASDDLIRWVPVADLVAQEGRVQFDQPGMSGLRHQFYRVRPIAIEALDMID